MVRAVVNGRKVKKRSSCSPSARSVRPSKRVNQRCAGGAFRSFSTRSFLPRRHASPNMTMPKTTRADGAAATSIHVLPARLEQLVTDCFDEEQCESRRIQGDQHFGSS